MNKKRVGPKATPDPLLVLGKVQKSLDPLQEGQSGLTTKSSITNKMWLSQYLRSLDGGWGKMGIGKESDFTEEGEEHFTSTAKSDES